MKRFTNAAGGLKYHFKAAQNSKKLWAPFREKISTLLMQWQKQNTKQLHNELLLIGPSAAYCVDSAFFSSYESIKAIDVDPLAALFFKLRHRPVSVKFHLQNLFINDERPFQNLLEQNPNASVLFCNILGQLPLIFAEQKNTALLEYWKTHLPRLLKNRTWASFHDRVSGPLRPKITHSIKFDHRLSDEELIEHCYNPVSERTELVDHDTSGLFPIQCDHVYLPWQIDPSWWQLIEFTVAASPDLR